MLNKNFKYFIVIYFLLLMIFAHLVFADHYIMDPALQNSVKGMKVYESGYQTLMQNAVNSQTPGYKEVAVANIKSKNGLKGVFFHRLSQGVSIKSGGELDFIIQGFGFFELICPWGAGFTRDGRFTLDSLGRLVTVGSEFPVRGESGEIYLEHGKVTISQQGAIYLDGEYVDLMKIVNLKYPEKMTSMNGSVFYFENPSNQVYSDVEGAFVVRQGYYESSNVNMTGQLSQIPIVKNMYDANTKAVRLIMKSLNAGVSLGNPQ